MTKNERSHLDLWTPIWDPHVQQTCYSATYWSDFIKGISYTLAVDACCDRWRCVMELNTSEHHSALVHVHKLYSALGYKQKSLTHPHHYCILKIKKIRHEHTQTLTQHSIYRTQSFISPVATEMQLVHCLVHIM